MDLTDMSSVSRLDKSSVDLVSRLDQPWRLVHACLLVYLQNERVEQCYRLCDW